MVTTTAGPQALGQSIERTGREIFSRMAGQKPRIFSRRGAAGMMMDWSMRRESLKAQLFRFVDVLPALHGSRGIARHARDYLGEPNGEMPWWFRAGLATGVRFPALLAIAARTGVRQMAGNFILARDAKSAIPKLLAARSRGMAFTVDILGETVLSEREAIQYQERYLDLIGKLTDAARYWTNIGVDAPAVNVSVKISALYSQVHPSAPEAAIEHLSARLRPILALAAERGAFINFDMEHYVLKDVTLELFKRLLGEPAFADYAHAGIAMQAYLRDTPCDLRALVEWARDARRHITVRLVKGAYWDTETILARQRGWPVPVYDFKPQTDVAYEDLSQVMLESPVGCAFATHNVRSIASCIARAEALGREPRSYEFQMLYGMAEPVKLALLAMGHRVREYCPIGEILPGMSYLVRRLLENTSNEGFLRMTFAGAVPVDELLADPRTRPATGGMPLPEPPFHNHPHTDFSRAEAREKMRRALAAVRGTLGAGYPLLIGSREVRTREEASINPARPREIIGMVSQAGEREADAAIAEAKAALPQWSGLPAETRAAILERAADLIAADRFELAALEVFETGKGWEEADADVAEAIDFCRYYAGEMRRIGSTQYPAPGEMNVHHYTARGIAAVIAPWNFPLAILCGMTAAALVAGNCAIVKPAGQSAVIGAHLVRLLRKAGVPPGAVQYLPGPGEIVGAWLVEHPDIAVIAFTGSKDVGLKIWENAARVRPGQRQLKKVLCEMGGKNAIIVDADADLDEAVPAILASAFGYQGQKCSACSRLIILSPLYDQLVARLIDAATSLRIGPPEDPLNSIGPVIDEAAHKRICAFIEKTKDYAKLLYAAPVSMTEGYFIGPTIFGDVPPGSPLGQEEIFGPMLAVLRAQNLDDALAIANGTEFALTGGFFSRSPTNIKRVKREFGVGNLYINRGITGALVARQPFGGASLSGGGTKAGGPDYLQNFLIPRVVTENLIRRGFVSPDETGSP